MGNTAQREKPPERRLLLIISSSSLQRALNFETPGFEQWFGDILAVFISTSPLAQTSRPNVLIRCQLEFLHCLLKGRNNGDDWPDGLRLAPVRITASPCHSRFRPAFLDRKVLTAYNMTNLLGFLETAFGFNLTKKTGPLGTALCGNRSLPQKPFIIKAFFTICNAFFVGFSAFPAHSFPSPPQSPPDAHTTLWKRPVNPSSPRLFLRVLPRNHSRIVRG